MEKVGYTGDVLCVVYGNNPDLINAADELSKLPNFTIIQGELTREVVADRFKDIKNYLQDKNLQSIYFGGGTPSLLSQKQLLQIFETIEKYVQELAWRDYWQQVWIHKKSEINILNLNTHG